MKIIAIRMGKRFFQTLSQLGEMGILLWETLRFIFQEPPKIRQVFRQMYFIGVMSLPVVLITGAFTGAVLAVQTYYQFHKLTMESAVGIIVGLSMTNELGPVLTSVMVAGRVGAAIAAELGTMRVTEQIDALKSLATNPVQYLIVPRFIACVTLIPILTIFSIFIGIVGGYVVGVEMKGINATFFIDNMLEFTTATDLFNGVTKAIYFAGVIALVSCYKGFTCSEGAEGVGRATTQAVVFSCITILILDFFLSVLLF